MLRPGADSCPVADKLGDAERHGQGWFRLPWAAFDEQGLPRASPGALGDPVGQAEWVRAWHGCKFESLYSIMYHGKETIFYFQNMFSVRHTKSFWFSS